MRLIGVTKYNRLLVAAAGSGKTTFLVNRACEITSKTVLITTYTEANKTEIWQKIIKRKGYIPSNIKVQTWFSFLLQHGVRPYQSLLNENIHEIDIGFYLTNEKSGKKIDAEGNQIIYKGKPLYWGEKDFIKYYFTSTLKIYSDKISKFIFSCNQASNNEVINRISRIFSHIFIDEIQDLAGYDLELIKLFFRSDSSVLLVGDPRQVTYLTHTSSKFRKYSNGNIESFIENELRNESICELDKKTLNLSHRNNQLICNYSAKLYPSLPVPKACDCKECRDYAIDHIGIFLIKPCDVDQYLLRFKPVQLLWSTSTQCNTQYPYMNFGESKGATFNRVLIYPTNEMLKWIKNNNHQLKDETKAKLYVGITRARQSTAIIMDYKSDDELNDIQKYSFNCS